MRVMHFNGVLMEVPPPEAGIQPTEKCKTAHDENAHDNCHTTLARLEERLCEE